MLGYLFFKKFRRLNKNKFLLLCSASFGFAFLIRVDAILFIVPVGLFLIANILKRNLKIYTLLLYSVPLVFSYFAHRLLRTYDSPLRYIIPEDSSLSSSEVLGGEITGLVFSANLPHILTATFGLLFAPGVGLFIFAPILLTVFFSFPDFFRKNKSECLLLSSFLVLNVIYHADMTSWHGLVAWGPRYLLMVVPFLLIPLGASLETRNKKFMLLLILTLGALGVLFNLAYVVQDIHWFLWSVPGSHTGLFGLHVLGNFDFYIHDVVIWTFQFSQLTHSISMMFTALQHDIYLLHVFGASAYLIIFVSLLSFLFYLFRRVTKHNLVTTKNSKPVEEQ